MVKLIFEPTISVLAEQKLNLIGLDDLVVWLQNHRKIKNLNTMDDLFPHTASETDNELLVELAGRKCYDSFGANAGRKSNAEYLKHILESNHLSCFYHAKMTFFFAGVSRKFSHQFIRNYIGSDRSEEGSPSQESTRYTTHYGHYVVPPYLLIEKDNPRVSNFEYLCAENYAAYRSEITHLEMKFRSENGGSEPKGMDKKRIQEAAAGLLNNSAETSFIWTTNPIALRKFIKERKDPHADLEMIRFATKLLSISKTRWPNFFFDME